MIFASAFRFSVSGRRAGKLEIPSSKQGGSVRHEKKDDCSKNTKAYRKHNHYNAIAIGDSKKHNFLHSQW